MAANRGRGVFGTKLDDLSYTRSSNGTWPYAFLRYKNTEHTFNPQPYLDEKLTACGLHEEQERQQFIARYVTDMRLVPHTKEGKKGCPGGTCTAQSFRYKFWLQRADGSQEAGWRGVGGEDLLPPLQQLVAVSTLHELSSIRTNLDAQRGPRTTEWRAARQHAAAAPAAGADQNHPGAGDAADAAEYDQSEPADPAQGERGAGWQAGSSSPAELRTPAPANSGPAAAAKQRAADAAAFWPSAAAAAASAGDGNTGHSVAAAPAAAPTKSAGGPPAAARTPKRTKPAAAAAASAGGPAVAAAAAAGEAGGADEAAAAALRAVMQTQNWTNEPHLVSLASHLAQMAAAREAREAQGSSAEAAKARAAAEEAITERERIGAVKELLGGVFSGVQRLQAGGAAVAGDAPGLLAGGNVQALPAGTAAGGCQIAEEAD